MLYRKLQNTVDLAMKMITKLLDERKKQWTDQSKEGLRRKDKIKASEGCKLNVMVM